VPTDAPDPSAEAALDEERRFVLALGGSALRVAGAVLVTHERLAVPRFNYVEIEGVSPERQTAFFERTLDHYFQRALRPTFRVPDPAPPHLERGLARLGFRPRRATLRVLVRVGTAGGGSAPVPEVRVAAPNEGERVAAFWTHERERPEFRAALETVWAHPNPGEALVPIVRTHGAEVTAAALVYRHGSTAGLHAVATRPDARGRGAATELVAYAVATDPAGPVDRYGLITDSDRLPARLADLGFRTALVLREFELPHDAALVLPAVGPPAPPRWRPPRNDPSDSE
jgi:GNAT superfamily N-acetyltransferase